VGPKFWGTPRGTSSTDRTNRRTGDPVKRNKKQKNENKKKTQKKKNTQNGKLVLDVKVQENVGGEGRWQKNLANPKTASPGRKKVGEVINSNLREILNPESEEN